MTEIRPEPEDRRRPAAGRRRLRRRRDSSTHDPTPAPRAVARGRFVGDEHQASGVDLHQLGGVSIWCRRFHVSFGAAELGSQP